MVKIENYFEDVKMGLKELLEARKDSEQPNERLVQRFFETHPICLLPIIAGLPAFYGIYGRVVITQPRIKSLIGDKQPDFLIVTSDSLNFYFNFIEIEDPGKRIFRKTKHV